MLCMQLNRRFTEGDENIITINALSFRISESAESETFLRTLKENGIQSSLKTLYNFLFAAG